MDQSLIRSESLAVAVSAGTAPSTESEALRELTEHAARRRAEELAPVLAACALRVTRGAEFAVARDALDALLRRLGSSRDDELIVRPTPHGLRVTRRGKRSLRAYDVWLDDAGEASCSCPDFAKAALGLCKHVLAVLATPRRPRGSPRAVRWDPVRPLTGPGDWLSRLWHDPRVSLPRSLAAMFQATSAARPIDPARIDESRRLATVELLLAACLGNPGLAEPAVLPQLERERAMLARQWSIRGRELDRLLRGMKQRLFPYQRDGVERFLRGGRLLLADDMGLGKTAQAIASCHALFAAGKARRAVVVAPAALKPQWAREWRAFTELPLVTVDGHPDERARIYRRRGDGVLLVNYEQLLRDLALVRNYDPDLVVLDEAQRIKNWETKTAAVVKQLEPAWRLVLTGTPMENRVEELASIMEWVDEHALEPRWRLPSWHTVRVDGRREVVGARNLDTLRQRLAPHMLRRVRGDVLAQLPPRRDLRISVELTDAQVAAHDELDLPIARLVSQARRRPLTQAEFLQLMRLLNQQRMICNGMALRDFVEAWPTLERAGRRSDRMLAKLDSPKLVEFRDRITDLVVTQQRKVVVFSQWRRMLRLAAWVTADVLARAGLRAAFFTGEETQRRRTENLVAFHDDPDTRVLFATDAGGVGLNLQRAASCCINLDLPWNPAVLEQRIGRIFRMGQSQPVDIYNLVAASGIEDRIAGLVGDKRALFVGLFDGTSDEVQFDSAGSFMTRMHELTRPVLPATDTELEAADDAVDRPDDSLDPDEVEAPPPPAAATAEGTAARATLDVNDLASWMSGIQVRQLDGGRVALELPRSAATALGDLLRALATAVEGSPSTPP
ncbi:MAG TPA: DEAD/DEAH box helicase [Kofleriaceae bacterium]|nr:DEAD/DEAH box helicase [Kofleriaceae bacterium]